MDQLSLLIPVSAYKTFDLPVQQAIMSYVMGALGAPPSGPQDTSIVESRDEKGLAKLNVSEAKRFLNNCSDKTTKLLQEIVDRNGDFTGAAIHQIFGTKYGQLRGAWSGLTKRTRTITKNPEAVLLSWFKQGDDWRGIMAAQTVASMRIALSERG